MIFCKLDNCKLTSAKKLTIFAAVFVYRYKYTYLLHFYFYINIDISQYFF